MMPENVLMGIRRGLGLATSFSISCPYELSPAILDFWAREHGSGQGPASNLQRGETSLEDNQGPDSASAVERQTNCCGVQRRSHKEDRGQIKKEVIVHQGSLIVGEVLGSTPLCLCMYLSGENLQKSQNGGRGSPKRRACDEELVLAEELDQGSFQAVCAPWNPGNI